MPSTTGMPILAAADAATPAAGSDDVQQALNAAVVDALPLPMQQDDWGSAPSDDILFGCGTVTGTLATWASQRPHSSWQPRALDFQQGHSAITTTARSFASVKTSKGQTSPTASAFAAQRHQPT